MDITLLVVVLTTVSILQLVIKFKRLQEQPADIRKKSLLTKLKHKLIWSSVLRSMKQTYLPQVIDASLFVSLLITDPDKASWPKIAVFVIRVLAIVFIPVFSYKFLWHHRRILVKDKRMRIKYGVLYQDVLTKNRPAIRNIVWFCLRRIVVGIGVVLFSNYPVFLFASLFFSQIWILGYFIEVKPLNLRLLNWLD